MTSGHSQVDLPGIMTLFEVADYLWVHPSTLYRMIKRGDIQSIRVGSDHRFRTDVVLQLVNRVDKPK